jgi:type 2 lantibiotic biosynthesis protein LanM
MRYSDGELRELIGRATPLFERNAERFVATIAAEASGDGRVAYDRLARWRRTVVGYGDPSRFARRLAWDGLDEVTVRPWLGRVRLRDDQPLPAWSSTLNAVLESCRPSDHASRVGRVSASQVGVVSGAAIPFEEILDPFVAHGSEQLERRAGSALRCFSSPALDSLRRQLLASLSHRAQPALGLEFRVFVAIRRPAAWLRSPADSADDPSREIYDRFVDEMLSGRLREFLCSYPVLARLLATTVEQWVDHVAEFCRDLDADRAAIARAFGEGRQPTRIIGLQPGFSDPHNGGRSVIIAECESDAGPTWKLVYKPKNLGTEEAFFELLTWLGHHGLATDLRTPRVLRCDGHGWVEYVEHVGCLDSDEARRYFRRAGMLLCLVRVLGGTDFHFENVIASGEFPVLIDTETLMYHRARAWYEMEGRESADWVAGAAISESVFATGLLPMWLLGGDGRSFDVSGLGAIETQDTGYVQLAWKNVNTDQMEPVFRDRTVSPRHNAPRLDGQAVSPEAYRQSFLDGFSEMHDCLVANRGLLTGAESPLLAFRGQPVRFIMRPTLLYVRLVDRLRHPDYLGDAADRSIEIEALARAIPMDSGGGGASVERFWCVYAAERQSLENLDVPVFTSSPETTALIGRGVVLSAGFFERPSFDNVMERLRELGEDDRRLQTEYVRATLHARYPARSARGAAEPARAAADAEPLSRDDLIASASGIARQIADRAIRGRDGSVTWLTFDFDPATERQRLEPMGETLYGGRGGVALFLAALDRIAGAGPYRDLALAALKPARTALAATGAVKSARSMGLGGGTGLGGLLYAFVRVGDFLAENDLIHEARRLVDGVTDEQIGSDDRLDIIGGSAGAILGLLALVDASRSAVALERAVACGRHLLERRTQVATGQRVWLTRGAESPLTGCAHGAAGIAYALLRLFGATGHEAFRDAAREAVDYEASVYSETKGNWPDYRTISVSKTGGAAYQSGWCTGATGIGLARIGGLEWLDTPAIRRDIDAALATTEALPDGIDQLCCGNMGRVELFLAAAGLDRPERAGLALADRLLSRLRQRAEASGCYMLQSGLPEVIFDPSLFRGLSGIGYGLLRLADPNRVPCVLLWEQPVPAERVYFSDAAAGIPAV